MRKTEEGRRPQSKTGKKENGIKSVKRKAQSLLLLKRAAWREVTELIVGFSLQLQAV